VCWGFPARPVSRSQGRDHGQPLIAPNRTTPGGGNTCSRTSSAARHSPPWGLDQPDGRTRGGSPNVPQPSAGKAAIYSRSLCHLERPAPTASACRAPSAVGPEATWMRSHWGAGVANERSARRCPGSVPTTTTGCAPLWPISTTRRRSILAAQGHRAHGQRYPLPGHVGYPSPLLGEPMDSQRACVPTPSCPWPKPS